jgi:hypothetical protein
MKATGREMVDETLNYARLERPKLPLMLEKGTRKRHKEKAQGKGHKQKEKRGGETDEVP